MADNKPTGWRKYFKVADLSGQMSPISGSKDSGLPGYPKNDGRRNNAETDFSFRNSYHEILMEVIQMYLMLNFLSF